MRAFQKLNSEQKRVWTYLGGFVVLGSVAKFAYFKHVEDIFKESVEKQNISSLKILKESREYGEWSRKDREKKIPQLSAEQEHELRRYLSLRAKKRPDLYPSDRYTGSS